MIKDEKIQIGVAHIGDDLQIIIDANEYGVFSKVLDDSEYVMESAESDDKEQLKIVYCMIYRQPYTDWKDAFEEVNNNMGCALVHVNAMSEKLESSKLINVRAFSKEEETKAGDVRVPAAILVESSLDFKDDLKTLYTHYGNLTFVENIINRRFIMACCGETVNSEITESNWDQYIEVEKLDNLIKIK